MRNVRLRYAWIWITWKVSMQDPRNEYQRLVSSNYADESSPPQVYEREIVGIFGTFSDAFYTVDRRWRFNNAYRPAQELWGRSEEELLGENT
jgi:hypothetical protein